MEELKKLIGYFKIAPIGQIIFRHFHSTLDKVGVERREMNYEGVIDVLEGGILSQRRSYFNFLSNSQIKNLQELIKSQKYDKILIEQFIAYNFAFEEVFGNKFEEDQKQSSTILYVLGDNTPAERKAIAKEILFNDRDYKYKSDKVKAFLLEKFPENQIVSLMSLREETGIMMSYITSIKKQFNLK